MRRGCPRAPRREFLEADLSAEEVLGRYCTLVYAKTGSYEEAGRRLGLDRRTVKWRVDGGCCGSCGREAYMRVVP